VIIRGTSPPSSTPGETSSNASPLEQAREVGALVFGRRTYEGMAAHWTTATGEIADFMNAVPKYVFSRTLERADWGNTTLVNEDAGEAVARLKEQPGGTCSSSAAPTCPRR
jgi:dihydrofolate reductase